MRNIVLFVVLVFVAGSFISCGEEDATPQRRIVKMVEKKSETKTDEKGAPTTEKSVSVTQYVNNSISPLEGMRILCNKWSNERKVMCDIYSPAVIGCHVVQGCREGMSATATELCLGYIECTTP